MAPNTIAKIPNEILAEIRSYLPHLSKHIVSRAWRVEPLPKDKHSRLWNLVFANQDWLSAVVKRGINPVLVGYDVRRLYRAETNYNTKPAYLALVLSCDGDGGNCKPNVEDLRGLFLKSLQPYTKADTKEFLSEITFPNSGLTIGLRDVLHEDHYTTISEPGRLVTRHLRGVHSAYLYWNDNTFSPRTIKPKQIVGIKNFAKTDVSEIVGFEWDHLPGGKSRQHFFQAPGMDRKTDQLDNGEVKSFKVTGWTWK